VALEVLTAALPHLRVHAGGSGGQWKTGMLVRGPSRLELAAGVPADRPTGRSVRREHGA
jgi:hypothetical protein